MRAHRPRFLWVGPKAEVEAHLPEARRKAQARVAGACGTGSTSTRASRASRSRWSSSSCRRWSISTCSAASISRKAAIRARKSSRAASIAARSSGARRSPTWRANSARAPGDELFHSDDPGQPCGMVVNAAPAPDGGVDCWSRSSSRRSKTARCIWARRTARRSRSCRCPTVCRPSLKLLSRRSGAIRRRFLLASATANAPTGRRSPMCLIVFDWQPDARRRRRFSRSPRIATNSFAATAEPITGGTTRRACWPAAIWRAAARGSACRATAVSPR